jgi:hypothetical protein
VFDGLSGLSFLHEFSEIVVDGRETALVYFGPVTPVAIGFFGNIPEAVPVVLVHGLLFGSPCVGEFNPFGVVVALRNTAAEHLACEELRVVPLEVISAVDESLTLISSGFEVSEVDLSHHRLVFNLLGSSARGEGLPLSQVITSEGLASLSEFLKVNRVVFLVLHVVPAEESSQVILVSKFSDADVIEELVAASIVHLSSIFLVAVEHSLNFLVIACGGASSRSRSHHLAIVFAIEHGTHGLVLVPTYRRYLFTLTFDYLPFVPH